jgi:uncharacterized membrane protein YgdD (TMEM256/DUF423 family)
MASPAADRLDSTDRVLPITRRVSAAIIPFLLVALGLAAAGAFAERRWSAIRIMVQVQAFMLVLILVAAVRAASGLDTSNVLTWLFAAGFVSVLLASGGLHVRMEQRSRSPQSIGT